MIRRAKRRWSLLWAARFVAKWEGFLPTAYLDTIASPDVWTIGYGHTHYAGPPTVRPGMVVTEAEARRILAEDLRGSARAVDRMATELGAKLTVRQRIALISGAFNCGPGILEDEDVRREIRAGNWKRAGRQWEDWCHAGGVVVQGLLNRRREEAWMMTHSAQPRRHRVPATLPRTRATHRKDR